ncbi:hypothetical protein H0H93_009543 [Arthromyces matolae]|nr:hypothetical protein H0H93_009543 [Arthromyces matolae]
MSSGNVSSDALAAAVERRTRQLPSQPSAAQLAAEHERRQKFRRLIDPAENLLREPENPKYQQFKPTNSIIKKNLVEAKGALEYAIEVKSFQPYYTFNPRHMDALHTGVSILKEFVDLENERAERAARSKVDQKAVTAAVVEKVSGTPKFEHLTLTCSQVKLAYMDDRRTKQINDEREKEHREARTAALVRDNERRETSPAVSVPSPPTNRMPGSGHTLCDEMGPSLDDDDDL